MHRWLFVWKLHNTLGKAYQLVTLVQFLSPNIIVHLKNIQKCVGHLTMSCLFCSNHIERLY